MLSWHHFSMPGDGRPRGEIETFVAQSGHVTGLQRLALCNLQFGMEMQTYINLILAFLLWVSICASWFPWPVHIGVEAGIPIFSTTSPSSWGIEALLFLCPCWKGFCNKDPKGQNTANHSSSTDKAFDHLASFSHFQGFKAMALQEGTGEEQRPGSHASLSAPRPQNADSEQLPIWTYQGRKPTSNNRWNSMWWATLGQT